MLCSSHFGFLVIFGDEVTKILHNLCFHFARQDGQDRKNWKENHATKVTKIPKIKKPKYGMNETSISDCKSVDHYVHEGENFRTAF